MKSIVLDASVAVKWVIPPARETLVDESLRLLQRYTRGEITFIVPDVFWAEVVNVLWKGFRHRRWPKSVAATAASKLVDRSFFTVSSLTLAPEALMIAFAHDRSVYDCLYVALAIQFKTEMITADERLANSLAARLPVRWLGAFTPE